MIILYTFQKNVGWQIRQTQLLNSAYVYSLKSQLPFFKLPVQTNVIQFDNIVTNLIS